MGNKCNPQLMRSFLTGWKSTWCSKKENYGKSIVDDHIIRQTVESLVSADIIADIRIKRSIKLGKMEQDFISDVLVTICTNRPGAVIGKDGVLIKKIKHKLQKILTNSTVSVDIHEIYKPEVNSRLVAASIAKQIVERKNYRRAVNGAITSAMKSRADGIKIIVSGRLNGSSIARTELFLKGSVPISSFRKHITYWVEQANTTSGIVGVCVYVNMGDK
jgi:small subunit ribosomal protein S3